MDKLILSGIELYAFGGVPQEERALGHRYRVDVELSLDLSVAAASDNLADSVDFAEVYRIAAGTVREQPFSLLEYVTGRIADRMLGELPVQQVTVRVAKLLPPLDGIVGSEAVEITRRRESHAGHSH